MSAHVLLQFGMDVEPFTTLRTEDVLYFLERCATGVPVSFKLDRRGTRLTKLGTLCLIGMKLVMLTESGAKREFLVIDSIACVVLCTACAITITSLVTSVTEDDTR